jgi:hypothetical protein
MKHSAQPARGPSNLSESVHQQLNSYALAASAASVGVLALASPAEARIVYTKAHVKIVQNGGLIPFDLNRDGIPDFGLSNRYYRTTFGFEALTVKQERQTNEIWQVGAGTQPVVCAAALRAGRKIGPNGNFHNDPKTGLYMALANFFEMTYCPWLNVTQAYLGLKFVIKGKTHFGWARVKVAHTFDISMSAILTGYAYETIPNKAIIAGLIPAGQTKGPEDIVQGPDAALTAPSPKPAILGLLAMGSSGLSIWRRKEQLATQQNDSVFAF